MLAKYLEQYVVVKEKDEKKVIYLLFKVYYFFCRENLKVFQFFSC